MDSSKGATVLDASMAAGAKIVLWTYNATVNDEWEVIYIPTLGYTGQKGPIHIDTSTKNWCPSGYINAYFYNAPRNLVKTIVNFSFTQTKIDNLQCAPFHTHNYFGVDVSSYYRSAQTSWIDTESNDMGAYFAMTNFTGPLY